MLNFERSHWKKCLLLTLLWFLTTKLNSSHNKFCLDCSLSNSSNAPLDNNTFAKETLFFFPKMLSSTDQKTPNLSQIDCK